LGLQAIRAKGGITFAQELESAKFSEMPSRAIGLGVVDFALTPAGVARQLALLYDKTMPTAGIRPEQRQLEPEQASLAASEIGRTDPELIQIFQLLRHACGFDFTHYKHSTIRRRIRRRMAMQG